MRFPIREYFVTHKKNRGGFTILELVLYLTIFGILGFFGARILTFALESKTAISKLNELQLVGGRIASQINNSVRSASSINSSSTNSMLSLTMTSSTINPTIITYDSVADILYIKEGASATSTLNPTTTLVTAAVLYKVTNTAPSTPSIRLTFTIAYNNNGVADPDYVYSIETAAMPLQ